MMSTRKSPFNSIFSRANSNQFARFSEYTNRSASRSPFGFPPIVSLTIILSVLLAPFTGVLAKEISTKTNKSVAAAKRIAAPLTAPQTSPTTRYTNNFDADTATTISDLKDAAGASAPDGIPDYQQDFTPANLDPASAKANGGSGLTAGQTQLADDGDNQTPIANSVQTDVVSDASGTYAGAFTSNSLVIYDGNTGSGVTPSTPSFPVFAVDYGDRLVSGTITLQFYDPNQTGSGIAVDFGSGWVSVTDSRVATASKTGTVTLKNGTVSATGTTPTTGLTYSIGAAHTLTIRFDRSDISKSPDGTFSYQIDAGEIGTAGYRGAFNPDRFSINNGSFGNTSGATFVDEINVSGVPEYTAPPTAGVTIDPTSASVAYNQTKQFTATVSGLSNPDVLWDVRNARGEVITNGGSVSSTGLYTAPATNGNFYVRAASVADPTKSAAASVVVSDTGGEPPIKYSNNFNFDTATTLADLKTLSGTTVSNGADGIPDYQQNFNPSNLDPSPTKANNGIGLMTGQTQLADDGDGQVPATSVQLDVVSDAATVYPGAFDSKSLVLFDGNAGSPTPSYPSFAADFGDQLSSGTMTLQFFDPSATGGVIAIDLGSASVSSTDSRVATASKVGTVTLKDGRVTAQGTTPTTGLTYTPNAVHTLTISFDRADTTKGANGTYTFRIDEGAIGSAGFVAAVNPDRFSINDGSSTVKSNAVLIDNIVISGSSSGATPVTVAATPVQATVDWNTVRTTTSSLSYGLNGYGAVAPSIAGNATYSRNLSYMKAGLIRFHYGGLLNDSATDARGWTVVAQQRWDAARINEVMNAADNWNTAHGYKPDKLVTIPDFPEWMRTYPVTFTTSTGATKTINLLDPTEYDNYAQFCAQLVRILNVDQQRRVKFFEATNERDNIYYVEFVKNNQPDHLNELIEIYNRVAVAMKAVDPTIQVGGPAFTRADLVDQVRRFVRGTRPNLDFMSYHFYATGNTTDSDEQIYNRTKSLGRHSGDIAQILREESPNRVIPAHVNEYNISYDYRAPDLRMRGHKGAVFDALSIVAAIDTGTSVTNAWNDRDGIYGKLDGSNNLRIGAETFQLFNNYLVGDRVATTTGDDNAVVVYAVKNRQTNLKSYLVVNRTPNVQQVNTNFGNWQPGASFNRYEISSGGYYTGTVNFQTLNNGEFYVPDHSVTLVTVTADDPTVPDTTAPQIAVASPIENAVYTFNQQVAANYACTDENSGIALCEGTTANGASLDTSSTGAKTFTINARDNAGNTSSRTVNYTVIKAATQTSLASSNLSSIFGETATLTATVTSASGVPTGTVEFLAAGTSLGTGNLQNGSAVLSISALEAGSHTITAVYQESAGFAGSSSAAISQNINRATPVITVTGGTFSFDGQPKPAIGAVTGINNANLGAPAFTYNGSPDVPINPGTYAVAASFPGNANYLAASNNTASIIINKAATQTSLASSKLSSTYGESVTFTATLTSGGGVPTGSVEFFNGTALLGTGVLQNGSASISTAALGAGLHSITARYGESGGFSGSSSAAISQNVSRATPIINVTGGAFTYDGQPKTASGTVKGVNNENLGSLTFTYNNSPDAPVSAGSYAVVASFAGNANYIAASNNTASITIGKATATFDQIVSPTIVLGIETVVVSGRISAGALFPTGSVTISTGDAASTVTAQIQTDGRFSANLPTAALNVSNPRRVLTYGYAGDANFNQATASGSLTVVYKIKALYDQTKVHQSGSTIPIKLQLNNAADANVSSPQIVLNYLSLIRVSGDGSGTPADPSNVDPDSNFRYDAELSGYIFNFRTSDLTTGTYNLQFRAGTDPTTHAVQFKIR